MGDIIVVAPERRRRVQVGRPIRRRALAVTVDDDEMAARDARDVAVGGAPRIAAIVDQKVGERDVVDGARHVGEGEQRRKMIGQRHHRATAVKEQRATAEAVAPERQAPGRAIPMREDEGAETARHAGAAPALEHLQQ